jgi:hypothetical protein
MVSAISFFVEQLKRFDNFEYLLTHIRQDKGCSEKIELTFEYALTALENISYIPTTRDSLNSQKICEMLINIFKPELPAPYLERIINIMYNL